MTNEIYEEFNSFLGLVALMIFIIGFSIVIFLAFIKSPKKPSDYFLKAIILLEIFNKKRSSVDLMYKLLSLQDLDSENKVNALLYLGELHFKMKEYDKSSYAFLEGISMIQGQQFFYRESFNLAIKAVFLNGDRKRAIKLYNDFLKRQNYDKGFKKIKKVSKLIFNK